jgi:hypothetical protein
MSMLHYQSCIQDCWKEHSKWQRTLDQYMDCRSWLWKFHSRPLVLHLLRILIQKWLWQLQLKSSLKESNHFRSRFQIITQSSWLELRHWQESELCTRIWLGSRLGLLRQADVDIICYDQWWCSSNSRALIRSMRQVDHMGQWERQ